MTTSMKSILITAVIALGASQTANASITASLKNVCVTATAATAKSDEQASNDTYSSMLSAHFNTSSCNGQQLLQQIRSQKAEKLTANHNESALKASADR